MIELYKSQNELKSIKTLIIYIRNQIVETFITSEINLFIVDQNKHKK